MSPFKHRPEDRLLSKRYKDRVWRAAEDYVQRKLERDSSNSGAFYALSVLVSFVLGMVLVAALQGAAQ